MKRMPERDRKLNAEIAKLFTINPWLMLILLSLLDERQWKSLFWGDAYMSLLDDLERPVRKVMKHWSLYSTDNLQESSCDVFLKNGDGKISAAISTEQGDSQSVHDGRGVSICTSSCPVHLQTTE